jgi:Uma2 family endonuclease
VAARRRDYFAIGTQALWDVEVLKDEAVKVYRATDPENPTVYRRGELAEAEPAVPGWTFPIEDLFN